MIVPTLDVERDLHRRGHDLVVGVDEVGRGALAGPVAVGVVVIDAAVGAAPPGLADSKALVAARREAMAPLCRAWVRHWAVGEATSDEIDAVGIVAALGLAGRRALARIRRTDDLAGAAVVLDGSHDWLTPALPVRFRPVVTCRVKADRDCASVAAASVIAKVHRDAIMVRRARRMPHYDWASNKGYASPEHLAAIRRLGLSADHRASWSIGAAVGSAGHG